MKKSKVFEGVLMAVCFIGFFSGCTLGKDIPSESVVPSTNVIFDDGLTSLAAEESVSESVMSEAISTMDESKEAVFDSTEGSAMANTEADNSEVTLGKSEETVEFPTIGLSTAQSERLVTPSEETESSEMTSSSDGVITDEGEILLPLAP